MADPSTSITKTQGGFDAAALLQSIFTPRVPYSSWAARAHHGADLDTGKIEAAIRWAEAGIMWPVGDMIRETLALNPAASSFLTRAFTPIAMADCDVTPADGDGLDEAEAKRIATDTRSMLKGIRGFKQAVLDLAWGFSDGRAALEKTMVRTGSRTVVTGLNWIEPQRLSFDEARRLIVVDRFGDSGLFRKRGPALDDIPGKFVSIRPRVFADLQEREGLAIRFLFWLLFDRFQWRHRLQVMQKMGGPIGILEQDIAQTMGGMKLPRMQGGEGGAPGDDSDSLNNALTSVRDAMDRFGIFVGRPGEKLKFEWPPAEAHSLFSEGSDQILRHLEMLALHAALSSASTEQTRSGLVVLKTDSEVLLDFRGALVAEAIQHDLIDPHVEMNFGPDALVYSPTFQIRTTPIRDRGAEIDRAIKVSSMVPIGAGVIYEASGFRPPNPGETLVKPPAPPPGFGGGGGAPPSGAPEGGNEPAMPRDGGGGSDAIGTLRDLAEEADVDDQTDAAEEEASFSRWFASADRKTQPRSANGSPEVLIERGVREASRVTDAWAKTFADAAHGTSGEHIYRNLQRAAQSLDVEAFTRALERRYVHSLMLGGLDAHHEMTEDTVIAPVAFAGQPDFTAIPFGDAVKAFMSKNVVSRRQFDRLAADAKKRAFTVAGLAKTEMLKTAHAELGKALEAGSDLRTFSKALNERFDSAGWTRLNPSHVETVFRTNVMGAYGDGRRAQMTQPAVLAARPYWQILGVDDSRTRPAHKAAHGKVLSATDPFFAAAGPPFFYNCRCRVISRSAKDLARLGLVPTIGAQIRGLPEPGWNADAIAPPASYEPQDGPPPVPAAKKPAAPAPEPTPVLPPRPLPVPEPARAPVVHADLPVEDMPPFAMPPEGRKAFVEFQEEQFAKISPEEELAVKGFTNGYDWTIREIDKGANDAQIIDGIAAHRAKSPSKRYLETPEQHLAKSRVIHGDLYSAINKMQPVSERVVYRGLKGLDRAAFESILASEHVEMGAVSSTSWNPAIAKDFAGLDIPDPGTHQIVFQLKTRSGRAIEEVSHFQGEREILLPKGTKFRVTRIYRPAGDAEDSAAVIEAEEI